MMLKLFYFFNESFEQDPNFKITICNKGFYIESHFSNKIIPFSNNNVSLLLYPNDNLYSSLYPRIPKFPLIVNDTLWLFMTLPYSLVKNTTLGGQYPNKYIFAKFNLHFIINYSLHIKELVIIDLYKCILFLLLKLFIYDYPIKEIEFPFDQWEYIKNLERDTVLSVNKKFISNGLINIE